MADEVSHYIIKSGDVRYCLRTMVGSGLGNGWGFDPYATPREAVKMRSIRLAQNEMDRQIQNYQEVVQAFQDGTWKTKKWRVSWWDDDYITNKLLAKVQEQLRYWQSARVVKVLQVETEC